MKREKLLFQLKGDVNEMLRTPFLFFVRANTYEAVGILTKVVHKYDSSWGTMRQWAVGLSFGENSADGRKIQRFEEPLDRKNKRTGELEDLVQMKTNFMIVTARNSGDPDDDNDENFTYIMNPHQTNKMKDIHDRLKERERLIHDLQKKIEEAETQRDFFQREAESSGSEIRMLKSRVSLLSEKVADVEQQAAHYRTELKKAHVGRLETEGEMDERLRDARPRGSFGAKDSADVVVEAAKKQKEAKQHLAQLGVGEISPEYATRTDLEQMERKIMGAISNIEKTPPPPTLPTRIYQKEEKEPSRNTPYRAKEEE